MGREIFFGFFLWFGVGQGRYMGRQGPGSMEHATFAMHLAGVFFSWRLDPKITKIPPVTQSRGALQL